MALPKPCPRCGTAPTLSRLSPWTVTCDNCYDGAPDGSRSEIGVGFTPNQAIEDWNEIVDDLKDELDHAK